MCETTTDNVLYIQDKINETDFNNVIRSVMFSSYLGNSKEELDNMRVLFDTFSPIVSKNDIIVYMDYDNREKKFYFVIDVKDNNYKTIEIDINEKRTVKDYCVMHDKSKLMLRKFRLSDEENNNIINSIPDSLKIDSIIGKKIELNNCKYIVVDQNNDTLICISESYASHLQINAIKNNSKIKVLEEVTIEELSKVKELFKKHSKSTEKTLKKHK